MMHFVYGQKRHQNIGNILCSIFDQGTHTSRATTFTALVSRTLKTKSSKQSYIRCNIHVYNIR